MKILIVGLGSIGQRHLQNLLTMGYDDIVLCRSGRSVLNNGLIDKFPVVTSIEKAIAHKPSVAFVCTPTSGHLEAAVPLARAGCHLFIEKPVSDSLEGCNELAALAFEARLVTMVGFQFRFHPVLMRIRDLLTSRELGQIVSVHSHWGDYLPDWHPWENYRTSYAAKKDLGGGVALTLCHPVDYLRWMIGEITHMRATVSSIHVLSTEVDEAVLFSLQFESGTIGSLYVDYVRRPPAHTLTIITERGTITWDNASGTAAVMPADGKEVLIKPPEPFERNTLFLNELKHFIRCVETNQPTCIPLQEGIRTLTLISNAVTRGERDLLSNGDSSLACL